MELWGDGGGQGFNFFFKHGHVAYQLNGDDEQNKMQVKFSLEGQTGDLGVRSNIIKISIPTFVCVLTNKK